MLCDAAGIPNYFISYGAYAPYSKCNHASISLAQGANRLLVQGSAPQGIQQQTLYFLDVIQKFQTEFIKEIAPKCDAADEFVAHANKFVERGPWLG